jgi:hypothetical protein
VHILEQPTATFIFHTHFTDTSSIQLELNMEHVQKVYLVSQNSVKAIPLQALTGPESSSRLRSPISRQSAHEGGKVVSPTHRSPLTLEMFHDHSAAGRMSVKNSIDTIRNRTRDLPACSTVPQPTAPSHAPFPQQCHKKTKINTTEHSNNAINIKHHQSIMNEE